MRTLFQIILITTFSVAGSAAENCAEKMKLYANDTVRELLTDDWLNENKIRSNAFSVELASPEKITV